MLDELRALVADELVAVVGNSRAILDTKQGQLIDSHGIVIRMNLGLPDLQLTNRKRISRDAVGYRTDVWATARYWPNVLPSECKAVLWMKLTKLGKEEFLNLMESDPHCPVFVWPVELEHEVRNFVGADPGTGIRLLYWLRKKTNPAGINVFGFDCWKEPSHWSGQFQTRNHVPDKERAAMTALGF